MTATTVAQLVVRRDALSVDECSQHVTRDFMEAELVKLGNELNGIWVDGFREAQQQLQMRGLSQDADPVLARVYEMVKAKLKE